MDRSSTNPRVARARPNVDSPPPRLERWLVALGADPHIVDAVFGDLAEEHALRTERDGAAAARAWRTSETLRSLTPLAVGGLRRLARREPARFSTIVGAAALTAAAVGSAIALRAGPPAHLTGTIGSTVIVNGAHTIRLPVSVRDARGRALDSAGVQFSWLSGDPLRINTKGDVTCTRAADATVRAAIGDVATHLLVRCRPVDYLRAGDVDLVDGDAAVPLSMQAIDPAGREVSLLAGRLTFDDSSIATFVGGTVVPRRAGSTLLEISIGDARARIGVFVHERATTFEPLRRSVHGIAVPVRLRDGETRRWPLPPGTWQLWVRENDEQRPVRLAVLDSRCGPGNADRRLVCQSRGESTIVVYRAPGIGPRTEAIAELLVRRVPEWQRVRLTKLTPRTASR